MTAPNELRLERLNDRNGRQPAHVGEVARVTLQVSDGSFQRELETTRETLNNLVFTAPGATEWLRALGRAVAAWLKPKDPAPKPAPKPAVASDAIQPADAHSSTR
jgi:hypothetical protein